MRRVASQIASSKLTILPLMTWRRRWPLLISIPLMAAAVAAPNTLDSESGRKIRWPKWIPTSKEQLRDSEKCVLEALRTSYELREIDIGNQQYIHTLHMISDGNAKRPILVLLHGYGAAIGFFIRNLDDLARDFDVYAIDQLGFGLSSRPKFTAKTCEEAERFFVESLEAWRRKMGIEKFSLLGHSFGAYVAAVYSLEHPKHVENLILASPVGVPRAPLEAMSMRNRNRSWSLKLLFKVLRYLWNNGYSPFDVVRLLGPYGVNPIKGYVARRFVLDHANSESSDSGAREFVDGIEGIEALQSPRRPSSLARPLEKTAIASYLYHISAARGSGEYGLPVLLDSTAYARKPLIDRLPSLDKQISLSCIYGSPHDWMDINAGRELVRHIVENGGSAKVDLVEQAGHQLMIDNPLSFYLAVKRAMSLNTMA